MPRIIYVVGNSRSGTTMLGRMLGLNPLVITFPELHFFEKYHGQTMSSNKALEAASRMLRIDAEGFFGSSPLDRYRDEAKLLLGNEVFHQPVDVYRRFIAHALAKRHKTIACEQTPQNVFYIRDILQAFPDARFVNLVRDPRDVLLSQKNKWKRMRLGAAHVNRFESLRSRVNYQPITISKLWNASVQAAMVCEEHPHVMTVTFEDLVSQPLPTLRAICGHVGIEFSEAMLSVPQVGSSEVHDAPERKGINAERIKSWQRGGLSNAEIWICQRTTARWMKRFGYEPMRVDAGAVNIAAHWLTLPVKLALALAFNVHRVGSIYDAVRRRLRASL